MRLELTFDTRGEGIKPAVLARLWADLEIQAFGLALLSELEASDEKERWNVAGLTEPDRVYGVDLGSLRREVVTRGLAGPERSLPVVIDVTVKEVTLTNPLSMTLLVIPAKAVGKLLAKNYKFVYERILFADVERRRRIAETDKISAETAMLKEQQLEKRLKNIAKVLDIKERIGNRPNSQELENIVTAGILPFLPQPGTESIPIDEERRPLLAAKITADDGEVVVNKKLTPKLPKGS